MWAHVHTHVDTQIYAKTFLTGAALDDAMRASGLRGLGHDDFNLGL